MSKLYGFYFLIAIFSSAVQAQSPSGWLLERACTCLSQNQFIDAQNLDELESIGDSCLSNALWTDISGLLKEYGLTLDDPKAFDTIGRDLGQRLAKNCIAYQNYQLKMAALLLKEKKKTLNVSVGILQGMVLDTKTPYFILLDSTGKTQQFHWLREFDGSARFFKGIYDYRHIEVEIYWQRTEIYQPSAQNYIALREIVLLEELGALSPEQLQLLYPKRLKKRQLKKRDKKSRKSAR